MSSRYGFFAIERVHRDVVEYPDGTERLFPAGLGNTEAEAYNVEQQRRHEEAIEAHARADAASHAELVSEWRARRERWMEQVTIETIEQRVRPRGKLYNVKSHVLHVTFPGGQVKEIPSERPPSDSELQRTLERLCDEAYPAPAETSRISARPVEPGLASLVTTVTGWAADLFLPPGQEPLELDPTDFTYGFPIQEVTDTLNELADEGWSVVHVSEDRGLYAGNHAASDAYVTRARYLLERTD